MSLRVTRAGFHTTVQDLGRVGHRASGVSPGGALDQHALRVANLLVGNNEGAAGLEATLGALRLQFADDRVVAWCGGNFQVRVCETPLLPGRRAVVRSGEELHASAPANGARAWFAISGGIDIPLVLGSRSTDLHSNFGGFEGRTLRDGDVLPLALPGAIAPRASASRVASWAAPNEWASTSSRHPFLRVVRGADVAQIDDAAFRVLLHETFTVTSEADRMGIRLEGPKLHRAHNDELLSEPVTPGTIQIPHDGKPILLLGDCQTLGGYPKIAHVITVDLAAAAQLRPGAPVRFAEVSLATARRLLLERERDLAWFRAGVALKGQ